MVVFLDMIKRYHFEKLGQSTFSGFNDEIKNLLCRNRYLNNSPEKLVSEEEILQDRKKTTVQFARHEIKRIEKEEEEKTTEKFCDYMLTEVISHYRFDGVSEIIKNKILECTTELCANVIQHTNSSFISTCGQFFPVSRKFIFSMSNLGETFYDNINSFIKKNDDIDCIKWALKNSHTTKTTSGGLGLYTLFRFMHKIEGKIQIISGKGFYEAAFYSKNGDIKKREVMKNLTYKIPGTIITIIIDLKKKIHYYY